jgi:hypothetical protein
LTKAKTKAQRRVIRVGRPRKSGKREPSGQPQRPSVAERAEEVTQSAIQARLSRAGKDDTPEARKDAMRPLYGDDLGLCIMAVFPSPTTQNHLWGTWQDVCAAKRNWQQRITSTNPSPQSAVIAMLPEPMQADTSHSVDIRTADEKDQAARRVWAYWDDLLSKLLPHQSKALRLYLEGQSAPLWSDAFKCPSSCGIVAARALQELRKLHGA